MSRHDAPTAGGRFVRDGAARPARLLHRAIALYAALLALLLLYPFDFALPLRLVDNGAVWRPAQGGLVFEHPGMVRSATPPRALYDRLVGGDGLTIEVWARAESIEQAGPARIVSYSIDPWHRNVTLGQEHADLVIRLRTERTDENGEYPQLMVRDVFAPGVTRHIVTAYDFARQRVYVDGELRRDVPIPGGGLKPWQPHHMLVFGNELTGGRPWLGTLGAVAFHDRTLSAETVRAHHRAGGLAADTGASPVLAYDFSEGPPGKTETRRADGAVALVRPDRVSAGGTAILSLFMDATLNVTVRDRAYPWDVAANMVLFAPFGALVFALASVQGERRGRAIVQAAAAAGALSLAAELAQVVLASRESSLYDLLSNIAGAGMGAAALAVAWRPLSRRLRWMAPGAG